MGSTAGRSSAIVSTRRRLIGFVTVFENARVSSAFARWGSDASTAGRAIGPTDQAMPMEAHRQESWSSAGPQVNSSALVEGLGAGW